jgi:hypothetical protein
MAATKTTGKTSKATTRTRQVPDDKVPAELRNMYRDERESEEVSLDFTTEAGDNEPEEEREKLFSVDGVDYTIPVRFGPGVGVVYLDRLSQGRDVALGGVLKTVMGEEGWAAFLKLAELNRITLPQLRAILEKVNERTMGAMEDAEGN